MTWFLNNLPLIFELTLDHLRLSAIPIVLGFLISLPIGRYAANGTRSGRFLLSFVGILYTVPSLALFVILPPLLGIGFLSELNVIIALTIYAAAIMVRSAKDAFESIPTELLLSADAIGYDRRKKFFRVELPAAGPVLLAGLRVVSVSTISLVTVGALVGVQSLGYLFTDGFQRKIAAEILTGVFGTMALALLIDYLLVLIGAKLLPWDKLQRESRRQGV